METLNKDVILRSCYSNMKVKVLLFLIFFSGASGLKAQTNFLKGYYITANQDTVHGYIEHRSINRNFKVCTFKTDLNSKSIDLYPQDIFGFVILDQDFYEKHSFENKGETEYGFFRVILSGNLTLLQYKTKHFVKDQSKKVFEITKNSQVISGQEKENLFGLGILKVLMKDCSGEADLQKEYKSNPDFVRIFKKYYSCSGAFYYETKEIKIEPHFDFGLQVSPSLTSLGLTSELKNANFNNKLIFGFGGFTSVFLPKVNDNIRLVIETSYSRYSNYTYFTSGDTNNDLFIKFSSLKVPLLFRYNIKGFFFDVGIQNQFILSQDYQWRVETISQHAAFTSDRIIPSFNTLTSGYLAGIGIRKEISNYIIKSSLRFSQIQDSKHTYKPVFRTMELILSVGIK